ncbi:MAG: trypsin-like peptidase domain-containing protein [Clostridia bacterium]
MKRLAVVFVSFILVFSLWACTAPGTGSNVNMSPRMIKLEEQASDEAIVEQVAPAVVGISAINGSMQSVGSGVAVAPSGYILTNNHVVEGAQNLFVYFANKDNAKANFVWSDKSLDIAIIKCERSLPYLEMGSSKNLKQGEEVFAIGTPISLQFKHSVTKGIISALNRTIQAETSTGTNYFQNMIQHDASINPGNSGGPLINKMGQVVGINTLKAASAEGMGFAIPIEICGAVISGLSKTSQVSAPYLGLFGFDASIASFYGKTTQEKGVYVLRIDEKGPAKKAGLKESDVILKVNGSDVESMLDLKTSLLTSETNDKIKLTIERDGKTQDIDFVFSKTDEKIVKTL